MTEKLYYQDPRLKEWETEITETYEKDGKFYLILKETAFYPEGGGQPSDSGTISGAKVLDVSIEERNVIHHVDRWPDGKRVRCSLDWVRIFDHMQQHSGQHLLSSVCLDLYGYKTVSFHLGEEYATIDVEAEDIPGEQVKAIENEANKRIYENRVIKSYFVTEEEMKGLPLVKKPKVKDNIRIVEIEGIEYNACGGTHLSRTGELGMVKLLRAEKRKDTVRLYFKCGYRALHDYQDATELIGKIGLMYNTGRANIMDRAEKREQELKKLESELRAAKEELDGYLERELLHKADGKVIVHSFRDKTMKDMQKLASKLTLANDVLVLFSSDSEMKVICMHNGSAALSCGALFKENLPRFNGRGGGKDASAQAGFSTKEEMGAFFQFMAEQLKQVAG